MQGVDPYLVANSTRRGAMPSSLGYGGAFGGGGAGGSRYGRTRLPLLPDVSEHPSVSPVGQSTEGMSGSEEGRAGIIAQARGQQAQGAELGRNVVARNAAAMADQAKSVEAYRVVRDKDQSLVDARNQTTQARQLGIDPASSPTDIARAASGPTNLKEGTGAGTAAALPTGSDQVATAAAAMQDARSGGQDRALSNAYVQGRTGDAPAMPDAFTRPITPFSAPAEVLSASGQPPATPDPAPAPLAPPIPPPAPVPPTVPTTGQMPMIGGEDKTNKQSSAYTRPVKPPLSVKPINVTT